MQLDQDLISVGHHPNATGPEKGLSTGESRREINRSIGIAND